MKDRLRFSDLIPTGNEKRETLFVANAQTSNDWLCGVVLALVVFVFPLTLGVPLLDPDEGLHAAIAREMVEGGNWWAPTLRGEPFLDKPILYFWAQAFSLRLFGMNEAAVRLPGLMFGLLGAVTTGAIGWRMFGRATGVLAGCCYTTMLLPSALAQAAAHDVALVPAVNVAILCCWELSRRGGTSLSMAGDCPNFRLSENGTVPLGVAYTLTLGLVLGLACLTKGLAGVAVVGIAYASFLLIQWRLTLADCVRGVAALAVAALVAGPWYVAMEHLNPGFLHYYFVVRHLKGFATDTQIHANKPLWYYPLFLAAGGLPWIAYLPAALRCAWQRRQGVCDFAKEPSFSGRAVLLLVCWLSGGLLFFSAAGSKLATYIWPLFPPIAILAAAVWGELLAGRLSAAPRRWLAVALWATCLAGPVGAPAALAVSGVLCRIQYGWVEWLLAVAVGMALWLPLVPWEIGQFRAVLPAAMLALAANFALVLALVLPRVAERQSTRELAGYLHTLPHAPSHVVIIEKRVDAIGSLLFYLDSRLRDDLGKDRLQAMRLDQLPDCARLEPDAMVAVPESSGEEVGRYLKQPDAPGRRVGCYRIYTPGDFVPR